MKLRALLTTLCLLPAALWGDVSYSIGQAEVTRDVGATGNVQHGNLPDVGDQVGWTLPEDFQPGVYRVFVDGRTGSSGEGTGFIAGYRLTAPDRAFAKGAEPHEIGFYWPGDKTPSVKSKGNGYSVFQGEMPAREVLYLRPGDQVRIHGGSGWSMVWKLILRSVPAEEQVQASLDTDVLASIFTGDQAHFITRLTNWRDTPVTCALDLEVLDHDRQEVDRQGLQLTLSPRETTRRTLTVQRQQYGPLWARITLRDGAEELGDALQGFCFSPAPDPRQISADSPFGIHKGDLSQWPAIGAKWVRLWDTGDTWNRYEKERGKIEWEALDQKVADAEANGVEILYVFAYTPTWASARPDESHYTGGGARAEAADIEDWRNFVRAVVSRYKGRVDAFEVWNEPNAGFFSGTVDAYVELLKAAYTVAKEANPDCTVLGISGTGGYLGWMEEVLKRDGLKYMDVVAVHTYTTPSSPDEANLLGRIQTTRKLIEKYGGTHPIWNTEVGIWQPEREAGRPLSEEQIVERAPEETSPNWKAGWPYRPISELDAARNCVRTYMLNTAGGADRLFWYAWYTTALPMLTVDNAPRIMTAAYAAMTAKLDGATFIRRETLGTRDVSVCVFQRGRKALAVAWSTRADGRAIAFETGARPTVSDLWGNSAEADEAVIEIGPDPQYIEGLTLDELATATLTGSRLVFESPGAQITADVAEEDVKEHTSAAHHGERRVMGLPDAGDEITWVLDSIQPGEYSIEIDAFTGWKQPTNHIGNYLVQVALPEEQPRRLTMVADPDRPPQRVGEIRFYGLMVAAEPVALRPGARISVSKNANWGFVGPLTLVKAPDLASAKPVACLRLPGPLSLDGDLTDWPEGTPILISDRKQVVIGVADVFASTDEHDSWRGPDDLSGAARVAWDGDALWVAVEITDDALRPELQGGAWSGDCVELFLDLRPPDEVGSAIMTGDVYQTFCPSPGAGEEKNPVSGRFPEGSQFITAKTPTGWLLEARVPLASAPAPVQPGTRIGFDIALDDADNVDGERATRKSQMVWRGTRNNFEDPSAYGSIELEP